MRDYQKYTGQLKRANERIRIAYEVLDSEADRLLYNHSTEKNGDEIVEVKVRKDLPGGLVELLLNRIGALGNMVRMVDTDDPAQRRLSYEKLRQALVNFGDYFNPVFWETCYGGSATTSKIRSRRGGAETAVLDEAVGEYGSDLEEVLPLEKAALDILPHVDLAIAAKKHL